MKTISVAVMAVAGLCSVAQAQEAVSETPAFDVEAPLPRTLGEPLEFDPEGADPEVLPTRLASLERIVSPHIFSLGAAAGYIKAPHADRGTWFGGAQARLHFGYLAAEAAITFHENVYEHGDVVVSQYPIQFSAFLYIIPEGPIRPYILGGIGYYYTKITNSGAFASVPDKTEHIFGEHFGAGGELMLAPTVSADADVRYIFLNPSTSSIKKRDFNYWQLTIGLNFFF